MTRVLFIFWMLLSFLISCQSSHQTEEVYYDENRYNTPDKIKAFNNKLYVLGQRFTETDAIETTSTILCLDTNLNFVWDKNFGNRVKEEFINDFDFDKEGNIFLVGKTGYLTDPQSKGILIKCDAKGTIIWRKEYQVSNHSTHFNRIKITKENTLLIAGDKYEPSSQLLKDSTFVQHSDRNGNILWTKIIDTNTGAPFLDIASNYIIVGVNNVENDLFADTQQMTVRPTGKVFCLSSDGNMVWNTVLNKKNTSIDLGLRLHRLLIEDDKIYALCRPSNSMESKISLIKLTQDGVLAKETLLEMDSLPPQMVSEIGKNTFMLPELEIINDEKKIQIGIEKDPSGEKFIGFHDDEVYYKGLVCLRSNLYLIGHEPDGDDAKWVLIQK